MYKIFLSLVIIPFFSFSQETTKQRIRFGIYLQPEMNGLVPGLQGIPESAKSKPGFCGGINVEIPLRSKISLRSGAGIGLKNYEHSATFTYIENTPQGIVLSNSRIDSELQYCEAQVPLQFQYKIKNRFLFCVGPEFNLSWPGWTKRVFYYENGGTESLNNQRGAKPNAALFISAGYLVPCTPRSHLLIEAVFKYNLRRSYVIPEAHLYNYGIKLTYNFL